MGFEVLTEDRIVNAWRCAALAVAAFGGALTVDVAAEEPLAERTPGDIRVMSFNIRYGTAKDGENHWDRRKEFLVETIREFDPDLLGTQETLGFQKDYLAEHLPGYEALGVGREDGGQKGEMTALFYRRDRFRALDSGHFWLSETPDVIGSKSWDSSLPRMVTWVKLRDARRPDAPPLLLLNTHFDHIGQQARLESAKLIRSQVGKLAAGSGSIIVTGDFNAGEGSDPYRALFETRPDAPPLIDSYRAAHPERQPNEGTFSGFKATGTAGERIDWIAVSPDWQVLSATINHTARDGRTPSDHFPVAAVLRPKPR